MASHHEPVMIKEVLEFLGPQPGDVILDCTIGLGGHAKKILESISGEGTIIGIDRDALSLEVAQANLRDFSGRFKIFQGDFRFLDRFLEEAGLSKIDGALFDLGISSFQLETPERGFSFRREGPLDMRMDQDSFICAFDLVNNLTLEELTRIIKDFGEERFAYRIAFKIVEYRKKAPIHTTSQLRDIILEALPARSRYAQRIHPATRTFQALRIAVNRELESLEEALRKVFYFMDRGARCVVLSYHSLEDRIVKHTFKAFEKRGLIKILTKKPLRPTEEEVSSNVRSRSARLRSAEAV